MWSRNTEFGMWVHYQYTLQLCAKCEHSGLSCVTITGGPSCKHANAPHSCSTYSSGRFNRGAICLPRGTSSVFKHSNVALS
jgi:hypothetical protein